MPKADLRLCIQKIIFYVKDVAFTDEMTDIWILIIRVSIVENNPAIDKSILIIAKK